MEARPLRYVLVMDWTAIENTPPLQRRPLEMQRWHFRVERLAAMLDQPCSELAAELKEEAKVVADRQRREIEAILAEDLAVTRAQGRRVKPPWHRKLRRLAEASGQELEAVHERIVSAAEGIQVVEA